MNIYTICVIYRKCLTKTKKRVKCDLQFFRRKSPAVLRLKKRNNPFKSTKDNIPPTEQLNIAAVE